MSKIIKAAQAAQKELSPWQPEEAAPMQAARPSFQQSSTQAWPKGRPPDSDAPAAAIDREAVLQELKGEALAQAREQAAKEFAAKQAEIGKLIEEVEAERANFFDRMEPEVARLAVTIAEKVIAKKIEEEPEMIVDMVKSAMRRMRDRETLRIKLNPDDVPVVRAAKEDILHEVNGVQKMDIIDDRRVARGGAVIESNNGVLDARIKTQLEEIERVITEAAVHGKTGETE